MMQTEFQSITGVTVTPEEYWKINDQYNNSEVDKETFCKLWCQLNPLKVAEAKERANQNKARDLFLEKLWKVIDIRNNFHYGNCYINGNWVMAAVYWRPADIKRINAVGINTIGRYADDVWQDINRLINDNLK